LACANRSETALDLLDSMISHEKEIQEDEADIHSWIMNGDKVHRFIAELSGNVMLVRTIISIIDLLRRASIQLILEGKKRPAGVHYHLAILEAIRKGAEREARELMGQDIMILKDLITRR
jgi:DNA-binding GntR family transcriptional regulator